MLLHFVGAKACYPSKVFDALIITYPKDFYQISAFLDREVLMREGIDNRIDTHLQCDI